MKLIVGLGNPGGKYQNTRHNIGFVAVEEFAKHLGLSFKLHKKFTSDIAEFEQPTGKVILIKPQTYMNRSGEAVRAVQKYFDIANSSTLVVYDEAALEFGTIRSRQGGESAGHNGIKSIISHCGDDFLRLRIGIKNQQLQNQPLDSFVLSRFEPQEVTQLAEILDITTECLKTFINNGLAAETYRVRNK